MTSPLDHVSPHSPTEEQLRQERNSRAARSLSRVDRATALNRLANARAYLLVGEVGAAHFELRLLSRILERALTRSPE
jgi:hypothetical protein